MASREIPALSSVSGLPSRIGLSGKCPPHCINPTRKSGHAQRTAARAGKKLKIIRRILLLVSARYVLAVSAVFGTGTDSNHFTYDTSEAYEVNPKKIPGRPFKSSEDSTDSILPEPDVNAGMQGEDTLELPEKRVKPSNGDSMNQAFKKYWARYEKEEGFDELRRQVQSNDIDHSKIPHWYFFDSSLVFFPFWFVFRFGR